MYLYVSTLHAWYVKFSEIAVGVRYQLQKINTELEVLFFAKISLHRRLEE